MSAPLAQQRALASGPWSGQAQCVIVADAADYHDEQTHTWTLTGAAPTPAPTGSAQVYYTWPATWRVQGSGRKGAERWTISSEMNMSLRMTEIAAASQRLRIGAEGQRGAPLGSIRVTDVSGRTRDASVQPWPFPAIEDNVTGTTISGTSARTYPEGFGVGWGQPPKVITTASCTWSFTRAGVDQSSSANTPSRGRGRTSGVVALEPAPPAAASPSTATLPRPGAQIGAAPVAPLMPPNRTIALTGFTAAGNAVFVPPRTIGLSGWSSVGTPASSPGGPNE